MNVRRISIGIFAAITAILFILSSGGSVTAAETTTYSLYSMVKPVDNYAIVDIELIGPKTLDISSDEDVTIKAHYEYENLYVPEIIWPYAGPTGEHYFYLEAQYKSQQKNDSLGPFYTYCGESGSDYLEVTLDDCDPGNSIYVYVYVSAENLYHPWFAEDEDDVLIELI